MKLNIHSLLRDKNVLYVTLFITIINMFAYLMFRQFDAVLVLVIIGLITSHFSKNMIIILLTAMLSTNLAISIKLFGKVKEGMENKADSKNKEAKTADTNQKKNKPAKKAMEGMVSESKDTSSGSKDASSSGAKDTSAGAKKTDAKEPKCVGSECKKKKDGFTQQLNPAHIDGMDDDEDDFESHPTVDYASTLESAYDNLDKLLSSDAINSMSEDTKRLAEKQQMLMGNINKLQPMMEKAGSLLESLNMDKMTGMLGGLQEKLNGMGGGKKQ
jgi:hypothetical protein